MGFPTVLPETSPMTLLMPSRSFRMVNFDLRWLAMAVLRTRRPRLKVRHSHQCHWSGSGSFVGVGVGVVLFFDGMMNGLRANGLTGYELIVELSEVTES